MGSKPNREKYWTPNDNAVDLTAEERMTLYASIKERLTSFRLTQVWLIHRLAEQGLITDKSEMSSVLAGVRFGLKADEILRKSDAILTTYAKTTGVGENS